jgi:hypothetical protein
MSWPAEGRPSSVTRFRPASDETSPPIRFRIETNRGPPQTKDPDARIERARLVIHNPQNTHISALEQLHQIPNVASEEIGLASQERGHRLRSFLGEINLRKLNAGPPLLGHLVTIDTGDRRGGFTGAVRIACDEIGFKCRV